MKGSGWVVAMLNALLALLSPELLKSIVDGILDKVENYVATTPNTLDDAVLIPLCKKIRDTFGVPDNDKPVE